MSAGVFITSIYDSNETGELHPIKIQPETLTLSIGGASNAAPAGPATNPISAQVSQGKRSFGLNARTVTVKFPETPPTGYAPGSILRLPWLNASTFGAIVKGAAVTYQGGTGEVSGKSPETAN